MIETLKKELLPGMMAFDLRNTLEEVSNYSKTDVSIKDRYWNKCCSKKERREEYTGAALERSRVIYVVVRSDIKVMLHELTFNVDF